MKAKARIRHDVYCRPSSLPVTLYTNCQSPGRSMQALMGLANNREKFQEYVDRLSACAARHLDSTQLYSQQPKENLTRYMRSVSKHTDRMDAYEGAWPAVVYAKLWINRHRKTRALAGRASLPARRIRAPHLRRPQSGGTLAQAAQTTNVPPVVEQDKENEIPFSLGSTGPCETRDLQGIQQISSQTRSSLPSAQAKRSAQRTEQYTRSRILCRSNSPSPPLPNQRQLRVHPREAQHQRDGQRQPPCSEPNTGSLIALNRLESAARRSSSDAVATFLRSLAQPLEHLLPAFRDVGVRDADSLLGLARLRNRGNWLYILVVDRRVTPLEYKFIVDGLDDLVEANRGL